MHVARKRPKRGKAQNGYMTRRSRWAPQRQSAPRTAKRPWDIGFEARKTDISKSQGKTAGGGAHREGSLRQWAVHPRVPNTTPRHQTGKGKEKAANNNTNSQSCRNGVKGEKLTAPSGQKGFFAVPTSAGKSLLHVPNMKKKIHEDAARELPDRKKGPRKIQVLVIAQYVGAKLQPPHQNGQTHPSTLALYAESNCKAVGEPRTGRKD